MPLRFTFRQLEYFAAVGDSGSVAGAAKRLNVSSPSVSTAIAALEAEFAVQLFVRRHAHGLSLTAPGRQLLTEVKAILAQGDALATIAAEIGGQITGPLTMGCLQTFAPLILPDLRRSFEQAHPAVEVTQYELDHSDILTRLLDGQIDIGLTYDLAVPADITFEPLATLKPWVIVAPGHRLAGKPQIAPEDLASEPMVLLDLPYSVDYFLSLFHLIGTKPLIAERTRDMSVLRALVANGYGYSLINTRTAMDLSPDGKRLVFVPLAGGVRPLHLGLAAARGGFQRGTLAAFRDHCRTIIAQTGLPGCF